MFRVVIPARFGSARFPGKPLAMIAGKTMLQHVYEQATRAGAQEVIVATDDERIAATSESFAATVCMTSADHQSGTDRIAEVAREFAWEPDSIVVNVQGDEPLIDPRAIRQVAELLESDAQAGIATLAYPIGSVREFLDPNIVKVVINDAGRALYFSRAPIPWVRDGTAGPVGEQTRCDLARRHLGLYAYRVATLLQVASLPAGELEQLERLEQLRALAAGVAIKVADAVVPPMQDVNLPRDIDEVERQMADQQDGAREPISGD